MQNINNYITEKLKLNKDTAEEYNFHPKNKEELEKTIKTLLEKRGRDADLNDIDVSEITNMSNLFYHLDDIRNIDISKWDVSNVKDMSFMFNWCHDFNCDLSEWDIRNVKYMLGMFMRCENFEGKGLENWDISNVERVDKIFLGCEKFNCDLSGWKINSNVTNFEDMFYGCEKFEGKGLENWDVSNIINFKGMFKECESLTADLENWKLNPKVRLGDLHNMFASDTGKKIKKPSWYSKFL